MSREEFIGKLEMVYVGDRNAFNDIVCAYDSLLCRNEKTIEYIKANCSYDEDTNMCCDDLFCGDVDDLLNILQNGSEDND